MPLTFQWDAGNTYHIIEHYPERGNTTEEVESLFRDPTFRALPDRIDSRGEQQYHSVGASCYMLFFQLGMAKLGLSVGRPANRKERNRYAQINQQQGQEVSNTRPPESKSD